MKLTNYPSSSASTSAPASSPAPSQSLRVSSVFILSPRTTSSIFSSLFASSGLLCSLLLLLSFSRHAKDSLCNPADLVFVISSVSRVLIPSSVSTSEVLFRLEFPIYGRRLCFPTPMLPRSNYYYFNCYYFIRALVVFVTRHTRLKSSHIWWENSRLENFHRRFSNISRWITYLSN